MSTRALAVRPAAQASGRLRRAAEHYVKNGCKLIRPSLIYAGYAPATADNPTVNGLGHDRLVQVAAHWSKGGQATARSYLGDAIRTLTDMMNDSTEPAQARGAAAKIIIDVAGKEKAETNTSEVTAEEQAKWISLIRHWKRVFLRRGILVGMDICPDCAHGALPGVYENSRGVRLLASLNYALGKGPMPAWMEGEEDEGLLGPEGDSQPSDVIEAEIVEEQEGGGRGPTLDVGHAESLGDSELPPDAGPDPTDTE